jgi:hypothetical protein
MVEVAEQGGRPVNRPRSWEADFKQRKKMSKKMSWHKACGRKIRFRFVERLGPH